MVNNVLKPGEMFLDYRIERVLGEGGMGIVYKAVEVHSDDEVAIKLLRPSTSRADFSERFNKECKFHAKLKHPHIVKMRRAGIAEGVPFIVLDFLNGKTLRALLNRYHRFDITNALHVMMQIAKAMQFAHSKKIWHRDLKPENIMVGVDEEGNGGHAWLLDFGIAKDTAVGTSTDDLPDLCTARYMSPEQVRAIFNLAKKALRRMKPDGRADIYAFGVIFYEILTGRHIFINEKDPPTFEETMMGHLIAEPVPVHEIVFDCPEEVWPVAAKCLAIDPDLRYQTFEEVLDGLRSLVRKSVPPAHPLARRAIQDKTRAARQAAFASLPPDADEAPAEPTALPPEPNDDFCERTTLPHAPQRSLEAPALTRPDSTRSEEQSALVLQSLPREPEQRFTAPLVNFVPQRSALPFTPRAPAAEPQARGRGHTEPIPSGLSSRQVFLAEATSPSSLAAVAESTATTSAPLRAATPHSSAITTTRSRPLNRLFFAAPLIGLAFTITGTVLVSIIRTRPSAAQEESSATAPAATASVALPPVSPTATAEATAPRALPEPETVAALSRQAPVSTPPASSTRPTPPAPKPRTSPRAPGPAARSAPSTTPIIPLVDEPAPKKKGWN